MNDADPALPVLPPASTERGPGAEFLEGNPPLILFGAGGRGRRILQGLRKAGVCPVAFSDNQAALWGRQVDGLTVLAPQVAVETYPHATFVATIWSDRLGHPLAELRAQLGAWGVHRVASFTALYERHPAIFLPDFFLDRVEATRGAEAEIRGAAGLWEDDASRREFAAQLALRRTLDFGHVTGGCEYPAYFPGDLFALTDHETFVDCGAYDGDTYRDFLRLTGGRFDRYIALEPDPQSFAKLTACVGDAARGPAARVRLWQAGVAEHPGLIHFDAAGTTQSRISEGGGQEVACRPLDEILSGETPSYIKMDIEGAEAGALRGAREVIVRHRPILAVSAYHRAADLWQLPLLVAAMVERCAFFLRAEKAAGWDLILYVIPRERRVTSP